MDAEEEERIVAVKLYLKGEKRRNICKDLNRSKGWLSKWVYRYKSDKEGWYKSQSRVPKDPDKELVSGESVLYLGRQYRIEMVKTGLLVKAALFQKSVILLTPTLGKICVNRCQSMSVDIKRHRFHRFTRICSRICI